MRTVLLLAFSLVVAGCSAPGGGTTSSTPPGPPTGKGVGANVVAIPGCGQCYEPTATWANGTLFVASGSGQNFSASHDGGATFQPLAPPPLPAGYSGRAVGDVLLQTDPQGSLWWSDLLGTSSAGLTLGPEAMRIARSDDGGKSWPLVQRLSPVPGLVPGLGSADRNWLAFGPAGRVLAACTCPAVAAPMVALSADRGATFGAFAPLPAQGRPGPLGPPSWSSGGIAVPYLLGIGASATDAQTLQAQGVGVVRSSAAASGAWMPMLVAADRTPAGGFPGSAASNGTLFVSWSSIAGGPRVASSTDGGMTWSMAVAVATGPTMYPNAWVAALGGRLAVAWYAVNGTGADYRVAVGPGGGPFNTVLAARLQTPQANVASTRANTDFPFVAWSPDGRLAAVWSDGGVHVRVLRP